MAFEFYYKKTSEELSKATTAFKEKYPETKNNSYPEELTKVFEKYIEVYEHALCMDVRSERKRISRLIFKALNELKH